MERELNQEIAISMIEEKIESIDSFSNISRRLESTPAWSDFLVIVILIIGLFGLLWYVKEMARKWHE